MQKNCLAYVVAKHFHFDDMQQQLAQTHRACRYRDAIHIEMNRGHVFLFDYGVAVFWGVDHDNEKRMLELLTPFFKEPLEQPLHDDLTYAIGTTETARIRSDHITLSGSDVMEKLAVSHGIAQSLKLTELEAYAETTIENTAHIPRNMTSSGSTHLSRKAIGRMRGQLFLVESEILLHHALLDTPEFFWEYPELEEFYKRTVSYLDVVPRIHVLNKKLQIIHDMFDMLADEQKHQHSTLLEWIVIWLIAIEVLIFLGHDLLHII